MRKTSCTLAAFEVLRGMKMAKAMLVLAPLRVCYTSWPQEVRKWTDFEHLSLGVLHGKDKAKVLSAKHDVYVLNYEGLPWLVEQLSKLDKMPFDMLIIDESTKMKKPGGVRFRLCAKCKGSLAAAAAAEGAGADSSTRTRALSCSSAR